MAHSRVNSFVVTRNFSKLSSRIFVSDSDINIPAPRDAHISPL